MYLFHGTNRIIEDGIATGSYFADNLENAIWYAQRKDGNRIYIFETEDENILNYFRKDIFNEHYISGCFIPLMYLRCLIIE
jgi:hypothetical protein